MTIEVAASIFGFEIQMKRNSEKSVIDVEMEDVTKEKDEDVAKSNQDQAPIPINNDQQMDDAKVEDGNKADGNDG